jgi:hypothetical protein
MKKILTSTVVLLIVGVSVFGSGNQEKLEFDPTPTKFEGEWRNASEIYKNDVYVFNGNKWQYTDGDDGSVYTGYLALKNDEYIFYKENGKKWWQNAKYTINDFALCFTWNNGEKWGFLKQPVDEFVISGEMFDKIQGSWKFQSTKKDYIYTFSGNHFSYSDSSNSNNNYEGTFEVTNNGLLKLITKKGTAYFSFSFPTNESLQLDFINTSFYVWYGTYNKQ